MNRESSGNERKMRSQTDRNRPAYVTELCHLDPNPVIRKRKAFLLVDPSSAELVKA